MSRDVRQYWQEVRALEAGLPEFVWLAPAGRKSRVVMETTAACAARLLHAKTHSLATEEEVAAHLGREQVQLREERTEQLRREGIATVVVQRKK